MTSKSVNGIDLTELTTGDTVELVSVSPNHVFAKSAAIGIGVVTAVGRRWISVTNNAGLAMGRFDRNTLRHEDRNNCVALYGTIDDYRATCERYRVSRFLQVRMLRCGHASFESAVASNLTDGERALLTQLTGKILGE